MANRVNYPKLMDQAIQSLGGTRPRLLLHSCCAPCSSAVLEMLSQYFRITILYYNPNIWPGLEYHRRVQELERFIQEAGLPDLELVVEDYHPEEYDQAVQGLEDCPERGDRCTICYQMRMERTAAYAAAHGYEWFCSSLSISPRKDAQRLNEMGQALEQKYGVRHLPNEFKRREGHKRSLELSSQHNLYRQEYCGCKHSAPKHMK